MLLLILHTLCFSRAAQAFFFPPPHLCTVGHDSLECFCQHRDNITVSANLNFDITRIVVEGCGIVTVPLGSVTHLQLDILSFSNIDVLDIRPFALVGVQSIYSMEIHDIREFRIQQHGFVGVFNVTNISIKNISATTFPVGAFGGVSNVESFRIEDARVGEVHETAFLLTNVTEFVVMNSSFSAVENKSFLAHNGNEVMFHDCEFGETSNSSFFTAYVSRLSFTGCKFGTLASTAIHTRDLEKLEFTRNLVDTLETDAFQLVDASDYVLFADNVVKSAQQYSLIPSTGTHSSDLFAIRCWNNSLSCDCGIYWMWEPDEEGAYDYLLNSSYCISSSSFDSSTKLSSLLPVLDKSGLCQKLEYRDRIPGSRTSDDFVSSAERVGLSLQVLFVAIMQAMIYQSFYPMTFP